MMMMTMMSIVTTIYSEEMKISRRKETQLLSFYQLHVVPVSYIRKNTERHRPDRHLHPADLHFTLSAIVKVILRLRRRSQVSWIRSIRSSDTTEMEGNPVLCCEFGSNSTLLLISSRRILENSCWRSRTTWMYMNFRRKRGSRHWIFECLAQVQLNYSGTKLLTAGGYNHIRLISLIPNSGFNFAYKNNRNMSGIDSTLDSIG